MAMINKSKHSVKFYRGKSKERVGQRVARKTRVSSGVIRRRIRISKVVIRKRLVRRTGWMRKLRRRR